MQIQHVLKHSFVSLLILVLGAGAFMAPASSAYAHRAHAGLTEIQFNPRTEEWEVIHRLFSHDLNDALDFEAYDDSPLYETAEGLAMIQAYTDPLFALYAYEDGAMGRTLELGYIGAERDGEFTYIYYTLERFDPRQGVIVDNGLLVDFLPDQANLTNLYYDDQVQSAMQTQDQRRPFLLQIR